MFLSNRQPIIVSTALLMMVVLGCSWFASAPSDPNAMPKIEDKTNLYPFETREPEVFAADLFVTGSGAETRTSYARKDSRWRFDMFEGLEPSISRFQNDKLIQLDHASKTFAEVPQGTISEPSPFIADMNAMLLSSGEHAKFEMTGTEGSIETYSATLPDRSPVTISYDTSLKMIVKQQFSSPTGGGIAYELRNIKLEVDDSIFTVPAGYKKAAWKDMLEKSR
jgi:hypothetical protein